MQKISIQLEQVTQEQILVPLNLSSFAGMRLDKTRMEYKHRELWMGGAGSSDNRMSLQICLQKYFVSY